MEIVKIFGCVVCMGVFSLVMPKMGLADSQPNEASLQKMIEKTLREHPEIVLDVLRSNSEAVLDIAQQGSDVRRKRNLEIQWREDMKTKKEVKLTGRPVFGSPDAKVRIVAFTDFTCHYCELASKTVDTLLDRYGNNVNLTVKILPLDEKGPGGKAALYFVALAQQNQEAARLFYKKMFANREQLLAEGEEFVKRVVKEIGVDMKKLVRDARSRKILDIMREDQDDAQKLGVEGTPHFLVNNLVVRGALPLEMFSVAVDMALKKGAD